MVPSRALDLLGFLAENLRRIRVQRGITQAQLAELAAVDLRTVQRLESGTYNARLRALERLCEGLGVEPGELLAPTELRTEAPRGRPPRSERRGARRSEAD
jgi:transcriptional regulator with XRE-family HTH domain